MQQLMWCQVAFLSRLPISHESDMLNGSVYTDFMVYSRDIHKLICLYFVLLIWALERYSWKLIPACFRLACPSQGLKCFQSHASSFLLFTSGGFKPAKEVVEKGQRLNQFSQPGKQYIKLTIKVEVYHSLNNLESFTKF